MPSPNPQVVTAIDTGKMLERLHSSTQTTEQNFLPTLFDYLEYIVKNPKTKALLQELEKSRTDAYSSYFELKSKSKKELEKSKKILLGAVAKNKIQNPQLKERTENWKRYEKGEISSNALYEHRLESFLIDIFDILFKEGCGSLIEPLFPKNNYGNLIFSPSLALFKRESERIDELRDIEMWHCWYSLKFVPEISKQTFGDIMHSQGHLTHEEIGYYFDALRFRQEGRKEKSKDYEEDLPKYKGYLNRLHNYLVQRLDESKTIPLEQPMTHKLNFFPADGTAQYRGSSYIFASGTKGHELLNFLFNSKNTPLELRYFQERCNEKIRIGRNKFKTDKDILDTVNHIKKRLKVNKSEYFPIFKTEKCFIWEEK